MFNIVWIVSLFKFNLKKQINGNPKFKINVKKLVYFLEVAILNNVE
jgi:hypothetical protein